MNFSTLEFRYRWSVKTLMCLISKQLFIQIGHYNTKNSTDLIPRIIIESIKAKIVDQESEETYQISDPVTYDKDVEFNLERYF